MDSTIRKVNGLWAAFLTVRMTNWPSSSVQDASAASGRSWAPGRKSWAVPSARSSKASRGRRDKGKSQDCGR